MNNLQIDENLRALLLEMQATDLRVREELIETGELFDGYCPKMEKVHLANAAALARIIDEAGEKWPGKTRVGADGAEAAWLIAQHAISLPDFSRRAEKLLAEAVATGEAEPWQLAYIQDRIAFFERRPQRYGTQSDMNRAGKLEVWQLEDAEKVNEFRTAVGLAPLENLTWEPEAPVADPEAAYDKRQKEAEAWRIKTGW